MSLGGDPRPPSTDQDSLRTVRFLFACAVLVAGSAGAAEAPALVLQEGSVARSELVAVGRDLVVEGHARADVAVVRGSVTVRGRVEGDVIALGGDVLLLSTASVGGNVQALGGVVKLEPGAKAWGRVAAYPGANPTLLGLIDGPIMADSWWSPEVIALKLGLIAAWLLWASLCGLFLPRALRRTALAFTRGPVRLFGIGVGLVATSFLLILLAVAVLPIAASLPLVLLAVFLIFALKLWGVAALSLVVGRTLAKRIKRPLPLILGPLLVGALAINLLRLVPVVGFVAWILFSLVAVGAAALDLLSQHRQSWSPESG